MYGVGKSEKWGEIEFNYDIFRANYDIFRANYDINIKMSYKLYFYAIIQLLNKKREIKMAETIKLHKELEVK